MDDIFEVARRAVGRGIIERYFRTEKAYWNKDEYFTLNPLRNDRTVGSFHIKDDGRFIDHASQDRGDFIDLVCKAYGLNKKEAAEKIIQDTGGIIEERKPVPEVKKIEAFYPITDFNRDVFMRFANSEWINEKYGKYVDGYKYYNEKGELLFFTARFEKETEKNIIPIFQKKGGQFGIGRIKELEPFPLYKINSALKNNNTIVIVEGEKCANVKIDGYNLVTWIGGCNSVKLSNWKALRNLTDRKIVIWPDADDPGKEAGLYIKSQLPHAELIDVSDCPDKWDIADAEKEGLDLIVFIECHSRVIQEQSAVQKTLTDKDRKEIIEQLEFELLPYDIFKRYIYEVYNNENLEHIDGTYWEYNESRHIWQHEEKDNIKGDLFKWFEDNNLITELKITEKAIHTFLKNTTSFLDFYAKERKREDHPFRNSAIQPYIFYKNGALKIENDGKLEFYDRKNLPERFFKELYPLHCLDFEFTEEIYKTNDIKKSAPCFLFYIKDLISDEYKEIESEIEKTIQFFSQVLAYSIIPIKKTEYFFGFYGKQNAGKSFFIEILKEFIGGDYIVQRPVSQMENQFASSQLWGSKIYVDDDFKANLKLPDDFIKNYCGQKSVTIEFKNQKPIKNVQLSIAMFFLSNHNFKVTSSPEGIERRLIYVPFKRSIPLDELDRTLLDKITGQVKKGKEAGEYKGQIFDERPAMLALALHGFELFMKNNFNFIMPEWIRKEKEIWVQESNTVNEFLRDEYFHINRETTIKGRELYTQYKNWCEQEERKPLGKNNFLDECLKHENVLEKRTAMERYIIIKKVKSDEDIQIENLI